MKKLPSTAVLDLAKLCSVLGFLGLGAFAQDWEAFGPNNARVEDIIFDDENFIWAGGTDKLLIKITSDEDYELYGKDVGLADSWIQNITYHNGKIYTANFDAGFSIFDGGGGLFILLREMVQLTMSRSWTRIDY